MANAKHIPAANGSNGQSIKAHVLGAASKVKAKLDSGPKAKPVEIKAKKTVVTPPEMAERVAATEEELTFVQMLRDMGINVPGWKRTLLASTVALLSGYVVGATFNAIFNYLCYASIVASGWTFVTVVAAVACFVASIVVGWKVAKRLGFYVMSGNVDADASKAWGWTKGLFSSNPAVPATAG